MSSYPCRLYLITPPTITLPLFVESCKRAFSGGDVAALQIRLKGEDSITPADDDAILQAVEHLLPICREHDAACIINDRPHLVKTSGADGVHMGEDDGLRDPQCIAKLRRTLGDDYVIGASCYNSRDAAMVAGEQGADYVSFGAFFDTTTKTPKARATADILEWWSTYTEIPCCAIGGITAENCGELVRHGVDFLAVISYVWNHPHGPNIAVKLLNDAITAARTA